MGLPINNMIIKKKMKSISTALALSLVPGMGLGSIVLFSDNFDTADTTSFDDAPLGSRQSGLFASLVELRSWGFQQNIVGNQAFLPSAGNNGLRFENFGGPYSGTNRFDWAAGAVGAAILNAGGFTVSFDWTPPATTGQNWISFQVGTANADTGNLTNDDYGILFRQNGGTQRFDGALIGTGGSFTATAGPRRIEIDFSFSSFADGESVTATSSVDGMNVAADTFVWNGNGGEMRMELGNNDPGQFIDNLTISVVPEPGSLTLSGFAMMSLLLRRRR